MKMKGSESNYLAQTDVTHPMTVAMSHVKVEEMKDGGGEKYVLYFLGNGIKPMILNSGNRKTLIAAYGDDTDFYRAKQVEVYVNPDVEYAGERVGGLRLRVPANLKQGSSNAGQSPPTGFWTYPQALAEAAKVGIDGQSIVAKIKEQGHSGWKPSRDTATVKAMIAAAQEQEQGFGDELPPPPPGSDGSEIPFAWLVPFVLPFLGMMG